MVQLELVRLMETGFGNFPFINATGHPIRFQTCAGIVELPPCGFTLSAEAVEENTKSSNNFCAIKVKWVPTQEALSQIELLQKMRFAGMDPYIVGSSISAQAFPGQVYAPIACEGQGRIPPAEKIYTSEKFQVF